jgi:hypothetical protein
MDRKWRLMMAFCFNQGANLGISTRNLQASFPVPAFGTDGGEKNTPSNLDKEREGKRFQDQGLGERLTFAKRHCR